MLNVYLFFTIPLKPVH